MKKIHIVFGLSVVLFVGLIFFFWKATKQVRDDFNIAYDAKILELCEMQLESLGILLDVYQVNHGGSFPFDVNQLLSDPNVIAAKNIFISGTSAGKNYRTRQERLKDLLVCPGDTTSLEMPYIYRGNGLKVGDFEDMILLYDKSTNHSSLGIRNVLFYKARPEVERITDEELMKLLDRDNQNRIKNGLTIINPTGIE